QKEVQVPEFEEAKVEETQQEEIQIVKAIEESKPKHVSEDIVEVWCLPCLEYTENTDPLYDESYAKIKYGETFKFRSRIRLIEDLYIQFITETNVELPAESVIYPIMKNRRWWRVKGVKEVKGFYIYMAIISDYQPTFAAQSN
ncbi:MAG: hypothetical protein GTO02_09410, partial [Candidatus Dadabacteria bacterium]|nr:hypothetical protein [Candidatus Dadabacteria bacterium]